MANGETPDKKHTCPDCGFCQWCSDERCGLCLKRTPAMKRKLSLQEQIALYEAVNSAKQGEEQ